MLFAWAFKLNLGAFIKYQTTDGQGDVNALNLNCLREFTEWSSLSTLRSKSSLDSLIYFNRGPNHEEPIHVGEWICAIIEPSSLIVMINKKGYTKTVNFMTSGAGVLVQERSHISHIVKVHHFLKILLLYFHAIKLSIKQWWPREGLPEL